MKLVKFTLDGSSRLGRVEGERVIDLSATTKVTEGRRGQHPEWVFAYNGHHMTRMLNSAWRKARKRAGLPNVRVHDLKHTFGRRLRAAGVSFEDRQDLLGHRSGRITTHYSAAELGNLIEAANRVCDMNNRRPDLVVLRGRVPQNSRKSKGEEDRTAP
jgi:integrase